MNQLLIEIDSPENEAILLSLLPKLEGRLIEKKEAPTSKKSLSQVLEKIAQAGGVGESFGDPSEWQREIRSWDRVLHEREE